MCQARIWFSFHFIVFQVRRQGRMHDGDFIEFKRPLTVRNPIEFVGSGRSFSSNFRPSEDKFTRMDPGPVFNLEDMLRQEATKLKAKVQEASLKAAQAAEEAEVKLEEMVQKVMEETDATKEEVENIVSVRNKTSFHNKTFLI